MDETTSLSGAQNADVTRRIVRAPTGRHRETPVAARGRVCAGALDLVARRVDDQRESREREAHNLLRNAWRPHKTGRKRYVVLESAWKRQVGGALSVDGMRPGRVLGIT